MSLSIHLSIISDDALTSDALMIYLAPSREFHYRSYRWSDVPGNLSSSSSQVFLLALTHNKDAISAAEQINKSYPEAKIAVVAHEISQDDLAQLTKLGVSSVMERNNVWTSLPQAMIDTAQGKSVFTSHVAELALMSSLTTFRREIRIIPAEQGRNMNQQMRLTLHLFCILGLSKKEVAHAMSVSENTVASRLRAGYEILGVTNKHDAYVSLTHQNGPVSKF